MISAVVNGNSRNN